MSVLYFFESIRNPVLDNIMLVLTKFAEEYVFIVAALLIFWCVNKKNGYYMITVGLIGITLNQWLKMLFRVPRPWVSDPGFSAVEGAKGAANDYSFPSGHTQNSVGTYGSIARFSKKNWIRVISVALAILIPISRLYLGVHTPLDVGVAFAIGIVLVFALYPLIQKADDKPWILGVIFGACAILLAAFLVFVTVQPFSVSEAWEMSCIEGAKENVSKMFGATLGVLVAWFVDLKYTKFDTKAVWYVQLIKIVGGVGAVLGLKAVFKVALFAMLGDGNTVAVIIEYFLVVIVAAALWPMTFKPLNRFFEKRKANK